MNSMPQASQAALSSRVHSRFNDASSYTWYTLFFHVAWWPRPERMLANSKSLMIVDAAKCWNFAASAPASAARRISSFARSRSPSWLAAMSAMKYTGEPSPTSREPMRKLRR
jgi:hypothetical protein